MSNVISQITTNVGTTGSYISGLASLTTNLSAITSNLSQSIQLGSKVEDALTISGGERPAIKFGKKEIDLTLLATLMDRMQDALMLIEEDAKRQDNYPVLKELYEMYRVADRLSGPTQE